MIIKLVLSESEADFIRHARSETLKSIDEIPAPSALEPLPIAFYVIAYDENDGNRPIAMAEFAILDQVYRSFADSPYPASIDLDQFCPIEKMAGIRTIYVEPDYRHRAGSLYLQLIVASGRIASQLGARFSTATTNADNAYLNRLYAKTGGHCLGTVRMEALVECDVTPWIFNIRELLDNKFMHRGASGANLQIDMEIARTVRSRTLWNKEQAA